MGGHGYLTESRIGPDGLVLGGGGRIKEEKRLSGSRFNNTNTLAFCNVL